ncbi:cytochrome C oxidase subunit II [Planococcus sp. YIM B11945]
MERKDETPDVNLKGTLVSVMAVGIIIIVMWVTVYLLYTGR